MVGKQIQKPTPAPKDRDGDKREYHVWARTNGNQWDRVTNIAMTHSTATTLMKLLTYEAGVPEDDMRFCVSIGKPISGGFAPDPVEINPAR